MSDQTGQIVIPDEVLMSKIYLIRAQKVMLDSDLAELFDVRAIRLREQVKRNIEKFPVHFMFQLTNEEAEIMVSHFAIPSKQHLGGSLPYVFTEHGVLQFPVAVIVSKIYFIRELKVMIDSDLADLYGVETRRLNEQVKRNLLRFPEDFMFQLSEVEFNNLKSQIATSSWGGRRKPPFVFTEHGVLMLSSILNSERSIKVNIQIMRIFTKVRQLLADNLSVKLEIEEIKKKLANQDKNIEWIFNYLDELIEKHENPKPHKEIGFKRNNG